MATVAGIVFTDLLIGISIGLAVAIVVVLYEKFQIPVRRNERHDGEVVHIHLMLPEHVTFLHKAKLLQELERVPAGARVEIDASGSVVVQDEVLDLIEAFRQAAHERGISVSLRLMACSGEQEALDEARLGGAKGGGR